MAIIWPEPQTLEGKHGLGVLPDSGKGSVEPLTLYVEKVTRTALEMTARIS